MKLIKMLI